MCVTEKTTCVIEQSRCVYSLIQNGSIVLLSTGNDRCVVFVEECDHSSAKKGSVPDWIKLLRSNYSNIVKIPIKAQIYNFVENFCGEKNIMRKTLYEQRSHEQSSFNITRAIFSEYIPYFIRYIRLLLKMEIGKVHPDDIVLHVIKVLHQSGCNFSEAFKMSDEDKETVELSYAKDTVFFCEQFVAGRVTISTYRQEAGVVS